MRIAVLVEGDPVSFASRLREEVWAIDPDVPLGNVATMDSLVSEALAQPRFNAFVFGSFGATALALAALGIHGVLSTSVAQRTSEIENGWRSGPGRRTSSACSSARVRS
jgi:ABC-type antimicrobial peptide transport system permease subunit